MSSGPNKISQFWQELKRRNVTRVLAVYIAAGFMILELVDMISEPFGFPQWSMKATFIILLAGLIITAVVSWIYDFRSEGGIVKTETADKVTEEDIPKSPYGWKIASYISFMVIIGLIILNVFPNNNNKEFLDKSIAVLPFQNDSPDQEMYFINGVMEEILNNLCKIEDLRVVSRSSVEQYRKNPKPIPVIAKEMNICYALEGSGQRDGDNIRLTVQLLDATKDQHIWSESYYREIKNIFELQSEIAQLVAAEIKAVITPGEKERIEKIPTENLLAYEFFLKASEEFMNFMLDNNNHKALESADKLFQYAIEEDSSFAKAYIGLARVYMAKNYDETYFSEDFLDSMRILADIALSIDDQLSDGYLIRGVYLRERGDANQALKELDISIQLNPNDWNAYYQKVLIYQNDDLINALFNAYKCLTLYHGPIIHHIYWIMGQQYLIAGVSNKSIEYLEKLLEIDGDSAQYYDGLSDVERLLNENIILSQKYNIKAFQYDSSNIQIIRDLAEGYMLNEDYEASLRYYKLYIEKANSSGTLVINNMHRIGYAYWMNGYQEDAMDYFQKQLEYLNNAIELGRDYVSHFIYYDLAAVYAFLGEKGKAYYNLRIFNQQERFPKWIYVHLKQDPLFQSIRDEPEFQRIVRDVEAKYQAEHDRVRQWLEENDML